MKIKKVISCLMTVCLAASCINVGVIDVHAETAPIISFDFTGETKTNTAQHEVGNDIAANSKYSLLVDANAQNKSTFKDVLAYESVDSKQMLNFEKGVYMTLVEDYEDDDNYKNPRTLLDGKFTYEAWVNVSKYYSSAQLQPLVFVGDSDDHNLIISLVPKSVSGTRKMYLEFDRIFSSDGVSADSSMKEKTEPIIDYNEWNHIMVSYDPTDSDNLPEIFINGERCETTSSADEAIGDGEEARSSEDFDDFSVNFGCTNGRGINNRLFYTSWVDIKIYDTNLDSNYAKEVYEEGVESFVGSYTLNSITNNSESVVLSDSITLDEGEVIFDFDFSDIKDANITTDYIKLIDGEQQEVEIEITGEKKISKKFIEEGTYKLVFDGEILDKAGKKFRPMGHEVEFTVARNDDLRASILEGINDLLENADKSDEVVATELIDDYNYILNIDISQDSDYSKIVDKGAVFGALRDNSYESIEDFKEALVAKIEAQAEQDVQEAVEAVVEGAKLSGDALVAAISDALFTKYASIFKIDTTAYDALENSEEALKLMKGFEGTLVEDVIDEFNRCVELQKINETYIKFFADFTGETDESAIITLLQNHQDYIEIDLENEDFKANQTAVIADLKESGATSFTAFKEAFNKSVLLNAINAVPVGTRDEIVDLLDTYGKVWGMTEDYEDLSPKKKLEVAQKMNGNQYDDFDAFLEDLLKTIKDVKNGKGIKDDGDESPKVDDNNYFVPSVDKEDPVAPSEQLSDIPFTDIGNYDWAKEGITYLYQNNIISGKTKTEFYPQDSIKRSEFAKIIAIAFGYGEDKTAQIFDDVAPSDWSFGYINVLAKAGIITGVNSKEFAKDGILKRCDMAVILGRIAKDKGIELASEDAQAFADYDSIPDYAKEAVTSMQKAGIINGAGENRFNPLGLVNRAAAVKVIYEMMTVKGGN